MVPVCSHRSADCARPPDRPVETPTIARARAGGPPAPCGRDMAFVEEGAHGCGHPYSPPVPGKSEDWTRVNTVSEASSGSTIPSTARTHRFSRRWPLVAGVAAAALVASGTVAFAKAHKTVTLDVDGTTTSVSTFSGDVEGLLAAQGVRLDDQDEVAPALDTTLREGSDVVVRYGRQVTVAADGKESDVWLNVTDSNEALDILASRGSDVRLVASRSGARADFPLRLNDDGPVAVVADGSTRVVESGGDGVAAILDRMNIDLGKDDRVSVVSVEDLTENGGKAVKEAEVAKVVKKSDVDVALQVERYRTKKVTKTITIEHRSKTVADSSRYEDLGPAVRTAGKDGERTKTYG